MAIRHCSVKNGKAGKGAGHAQYIAGEGRYGEKADVVAVIDGNLPTWATSAEDFFAAADELERANGRAYREIEFAIPREVDDPVAYAQDFARQMLGERFVYRLAVHDKQAADGGRNVHGHLMFSERALDGIERERDQFFRRANPKAPEKGGAAKDRAWNDRGAVQMVRDRYAEHAGRHGVAIDMRSNEAQGLDAPEPKIGPKAKERLRMVNARAAVVAGIRAERQAEQHAESELAAVRAEIAKVELEHKAKEKAKPKLPPLLEKLLARFRAEGNELAEVKPAQAGKRYTGQIVELTDTEAAQALGRQSYAVHQLADLDRRPALGESVAVQYDASRRGTVTSRVRTTGRGRN